MSSAAPAAAPAVGDMSGGILGMGNPLLDISSPVTQEFLDKYEVKVDNAILAEAKHLPMYDELAKMETVEYIAGGSTLNTLRVTQWMLKGVAGCEGSTGYIGCIADDAFGKLLSENCKSDGVNGNFMISKENPTGTCAVCILDKERGLIANLAAANDYKIAHLKEEASMAMLQKAQIIYSAGFFLTVAPDAMVCAGQHAEENDKVFAINLSAEFIPKFFGEKMAEVLPYTDFVFGNEDEAKAFGEAQKWETNSVEEIAKKMSLMESKRKNPRKVVITQGANAVIVACKGEIESFPVPALDKSKIVDANGAGDSFVAGFLSQLLQKKELSVCVSAGCYAAQYVIQQSGCQMPQPSQWKE